MRQPDRIALAALLLLWPGAAAAQSAGCEASQLTDPPRTVLRCPNRLTITAEEGSTYELEGGSRTRGPTGASLSGRALLVETPNGVRRHFQIRTPQAVASVRGTIWAVDVAETQTSVFVQRGAVAVRRQNTRQAVTLHPGEGVDVTDEPGPLVVRRWPEERVRRLLARLGR